MTTPPILPDLRLPDFIGIGAPKAATTWLTSVLDSHPRVYMTPVKETHFFDYPYTQYPFSKYAVFFADARPDQLAGEFSTDYLTSVEAPARVHHHLPAVRLIVSFRNPIDQIYSNYWHALRQGFNCSDGTSPDFETALDRHRERLLGTARFGHHFQRWLRHFPIERFLVVFQEDVQSDPANVARRLWQFLELTPPAESSLPSRNRSERAGVSPRSQVGIRLYNRLYFAANNLVLRPLAKRYGYETPMRLINRLGLRRMAEYLFFRQGYPPMSTKQRQQLHSLLADDIRLLAQLTGRDLGHWR